MSGEVWRKAGAAASHVSMLLDWKGCTIVISDNLRGQYEYVTGARYDEEMDAIVIYDVETWEPDHER